MGVGRASRVRVAEVLAAFAASRLRTLLCLLPLVAALAIPCNAVASEVFVTNRDSNSVSLFATTAAGSLTPIACPGTNCSTDFGPEGVAVTPDGQFLYVANNGNSSHSTTNISPFRV